MTRIAIAGYGNLGRGVEAAIRQNPDMELTAVFTRRPGVEISTPGVPVLPMDSAPEMVGCADVMVICGGSATDLPVITPRLAEYFSVVDSYDTHSRIPEHFAAVDAAARRGGRLALISAGWDPGLFSLARIVFAAALPEGDDCTFWGPGVSQGHSDAIRRVEGVIDARQYTVPVPAAMEAVRRGEAPNLTAGEKHTRVCYVAAAPDADRERIAAQIRAMPGYFDEYETAVNFISPSELAEKHSELPHGGFVIRGGVTGADRCHRSTAELRLELDSNPEFTASLLTACARAVHRMSARGETGCITMPDIPPALLSPLTAEELRARLL